MKFSRPTIQLRLRGPRVLVSSLKSNPQKIIEVDVFQLAAGPFETLEKNFPGSRFGDSG